MYFRSDSEFLFIFLLNNKRPNLAFKREHFPNTFKGKFQTIPQNLENNMIEEAPN